MPLLCMVQVREVVTEAILAMPLLKSVTLYILPHGQYVPPFTPLSKFFVPVPFFIGCEYVLFFRDTLILPQVVLQFQMEEIVSMLPILCEQAAQSFDAFSECIIIDSYDLSYMP